MMIKDHLHVILFVLFFIEPESRKEVYLSMKLLQSNKIFNQKIAMKCLVIAWTFLQLNSKNIPANTSTLKQRWSSTFINVVSTLIFGWKWKLSRRTFIDVVSTLAKQRWNIVDRITSIQRRWTNVVSTLKFGWKWKLSRPMFIGIASTLSKHHLNNFINCCTNVH